MTTDQPDFEEALDRKDAHGECPACGASDRWMTDWDRTIIVPLAEADGRNIGNGIAAAAMICRDCGFIRLHGRDLLLN